MTSYGLLAITMSSDQELMARIRQRDTSALGELYDAYGSRVFSLAVAILGDGMGAQEITQDTFLKVWQRPNLYQHEAGRFAGWLLTIRRRLAIDWLHSKYRRGCRSTSLDHY